MRTAKIERKTRETQIVVEINLDGTGSSSLDTGIGFLNHMLGLFAKHGQFDLTVKAKGDLETDEHHAVEDIGICLGQAIEKAVGDKRGINRYGYFILPMDEALTMASLDLAGRFYFSLDTAFEREKVGELSTELVYDFFDALAQNAEMNLHIKTLAGRNDHHKIEGIFKATARALRMAVQIDSRIQEQLPSTKGVL